MNTTQKEILAHEIAAQLAQVEGVVAVVLGGSYARGDARPDSDIDLGIYYHSAMPPDLVALRRLAQELDDRHLPKLATHFGEWGPWINGGAWIQVQGQHVDWLYRDLERVATVIEQCSAGQVERIYQPGHPAGFFSSIYMGEIHICRPLHDPSGIITHLKGRTTPYPPHMKRSIITSYLWQAGFALETCMKIAQRDDSYYVAGSLFQCATCLVQVIFALNEQYLINEKGAVAIADRLPLRPENLGVIISVVSGHSGTTPNELVASVRKMEALHQQIQKLCSPCLSV